jgi:hypothetical protein
MEIPMNEAKRKVEDTDRAVAAAAAGVADAKRLEEEAVAAASALHARLNAAEPDSRDFRALLNEKVVADARVDAWRARVAHAEREFAREQERRHELSLEVLRAEAAAAEEKLQEEYGRVESLMLQVEKDMAAALQRLHATWAAARPISLSAGRGELAQPRLGLLATYAANVARDPRGFWNEFGQVRFDAQLREFERDRERTMFEANTRRNEEARNRPPTSQPSSWRGLEPAGSGRVRSEP